MCICAYVITNLSASSSTSISIVFREKEGALCRWSTSLPGVAMTTSGFLRSIATWLLLSSPPSGGYKEKQKVYRVHRNTVIKRNRLQLTWATVTFT